MTEPVAQRLRTAGLRVTGPRKAVLGVLDSDQTRRQHLTVAHITRQARDGLGSLSTQAVYDCLEALVGAGLARRIEPAGHPARYEGRVGDNHHHLVCRGCGQTSDVDCVVGPAPCLSIAPPDGFVVDEAEVLFWGHCSACLPPGGPSLPPPSVPATPAQPARPTASERNAS